MKWLLVLMIGLLVATAALAGQSDVIGRVTQDGAVTIEGQKFSDPVHLKAKLAELDSRKPPPRLYLLASHDMPWKKISAAVSLFQRAGWKAPLGVLTEPEPLKAPKHP